MSLSQENQLESLRIVLTENKGKSVVANKDFQVGELVLSARREYVEKERTQHSVQWDHETHMQLEEPARLINHSCDANLVVRRNSYECYDFLAFKKIETGTELTFDYETTEYISISVPYCLCGSERCRGSLIGFKFRSELLKCLYDGNVADYLKD